MFKRTVDKKMVIALCVVAIFIVSLSIVMIVQSSRMADAESDNVSVENVIDDCENCVECVNCGGYGVFAGYVGECTTCFGEDENCLMCSGTGEVVYQGPFICTVCNGTGVICLDE